MEAARRQRLLAPPALPWTEWALERGDLETVLELVDGHPGPIVECGSGISTVAIARLLAECGDGGLYALEHDAGHATRVRAALADEGLGRRAKVIDAPLAPHPLAEAACGWYAPRALAQVPQAGIRILLVDGPPANGPDRERSRYPALPALRPRLAPGAAIVLDDADRDGERWVLERWQRETGLSFSRPPGSRLALARLA
jgi:hypothetical protein